MEVWDTIGFYPESFKPTMGIETIHKPRFRTTVTELLSRSIFQYTASLIEHTQAEGATDDVRQGPRAGTDIGNTDYRGPDGIQGSKDYCRYLGEGRRHQYTNFCDEKEDPSLSLQRDQAPS